MTSRKQVRDLKSSIEVVFKHKKKVMAVFLLTVLITLAIAHIQVPYYDVRSVIMVKYGRQYVPVGESDDFKYPLVFHEAIVNTEILIITSRDLLSSVVSAIGPKVLYPKLSKKLNESAALDAATNWFRDDLGTKAVPGSNAVEITFRHEDRQIAEQAVTKLLEILVEKQLKIFSSMKSTFLGDQVKLYRDKVEAAEEELSEFKDAHNITSLKDQFFYLERNRTELASMLKSEESKLSELREKRTYLKTHQRRAAEDLYMSTTRKTLTDLRTKETIMRQTYRSDSPPLKSLAKEIETVQNTLRRYEEERNRESGEWVGVEAQLKPQQIKINSIREQVTKLDKQLHELTVSGDEMASLERDLSLDQATYEIYLKRYEEARISDDMDRRKLVNISIIEPPASPSLARKVSTPKILAVGLALAPVLAIALAFLLETSMKGVTTPESVVSQLGMRVLVTVPHKA